jgi:hypothetical protein
VADEESELDDLYAAPLDQFVKVRNEIAARLRKDGDEEAAARVSALKKPSVSAWAVNQLARTGSLDLQRLIKAGEALEQAQTRALSGEDSSGFQDARRDEAAAISLLRTAAKQVLPSSSAAILDRIVSTLRAGAATPVGRAMLKQGRLTEDLEAAGFAAFSGVPATTAPKKTSARKAGTGKQQDKIASLRQRLRDAEKSASARDAEARDLEAEAREAESLARKATRAAATARQRADAAEAEAESIKEELTDLEKGR